MMLFDLRVVLAACLATLFFLVAGLGLLVGLRSPLKASAGYANGPVIAGPGLPQERYWPVPEESKPEVTGSIVAEPATPEPAAKNTPVPARAAPAAKSPSITMLIEEDKASREKAAKAAKAASAVKKKAAVKKKKPHRAARKPQPPANNPFSLFTPNRNTATQ